MSDDTTTVAELRQMVARFVGERNWEKFHTPKNLAMALAIEAAELMEHFQWLTTAESEQFSSDPARVAAAGEELADVICYSLAMANALGLDVADAMRAKMLKNIAKYPADEFQGKYRAE